MNLVKTAILASLLVFAPSARAQDGTIYPLENPAEPNAITLGTGGVEAQTAPESWFRQWGDPMGKSGSDRNISLITNNLTLFYTHKKALKASFWQ